jgi:hypothetical protein
MSSNATDNNTHDTTHHATHKRTWHCFAHYPWALIRILKRRWISYESHLDRLER